jgi:hypothetical protein
LRAERFYDQSVIREFRATGGTAGGAFEGEPLASKGGADTNPDWYANLVTGLETWSPMVAHE